MIGWILHILLLIGKNDFFLRLPAILSTIFVGIGIYFLLKPYDKIKAYLISILFLISPFNLFTVFLTNDMPLVVFSFFSVYFLSRAIKTDNHFFYIFSGIFLGFAFLSKYFAVFIGFSYFIYFLISKYLYLK